PAPSPLLPRLPPRVVQSILGCRPIVLRQHGRRADIIDVIEIRLRAVVPGIGPVAPPQNVQSAVNAQPAPIGIKHVLVDAGPVRVGPLHTVSQGVVSEAPSRAAVYRGDAPL